MQHYFFFCGIQDIQNFKTCYKVYKYITFSVGNKTNCNIWWLIVQSRARTREKEKTTHDILWAEFGRERVFAFKSLPSPTCLPLSFFRAYIYHEKSDIFLHRHRKRQKKHPPNCAFLALRKRDSSNPSTREKTFQNWREKKKERKCLCLNSSSFRRIFCTNIHTHITQELNHS